MWDLGWVGKLGRAGVPAWAFWGPSQEPSSLNPRPGLEVPEEHRGNSCPPIDLGDQLEEGVAQGGVGNSNGNIS